MGNTVYKKGHRLVWISFLLMFVANAIRVIGGMEILGSLLGAIFLAIFLYGNLLVLKSKNRAWLWIVLAFIPPVFGAVFIFMLKDKSTIESVPTSPTNSTL